MEKLRDTRDTADIIEIIKDKLSLKKGDKKIFDKDVADELEMTSSSLASCKKRNNIPFTQTIKYCIKNGYDLNELLTKQINP